MESTDTPTGPAPTAPRWTPTPVTDWIAAAVIAVIGLALTIGGTALTFVVDRALLGETVTAGELTVLVLERELTRIETIDVTRAVIEWTGIGLLVTGLGLVVFAVGYVIARRPTRDGAAVGTGWAVVVYGAVATTILSFLPASPVFGGALAGYLTRFETNTPVRSGAQAGLAAMAPLVVLSVFVGIGVYTGLAGIGASGFGLVTGISLLLTVVVTGLTGAALGALGGYAGGRLAERRV